ncbi:MAG: RHS repeat-associated core domain-containing protein, partial [Pseudomonadota bacterium]
SVTRDEAGRIVRQTDFDGATTELTPDACGRVVAIKRPSGAVTQIENDPAGRPTKVTFADGTANEYAYREDGVLVAANNGNAQVTFERDALGRVVREVQGEHWVASTYDPAGRRIGVRTSLELEEKIVLDGRGLPRRIEARRGQEPWWWAELDRDRAGAETGRRFPGGEVFTTRDDAGQPQQQRIVTGGAERHARTYVWDQAGELSRLVDPARGPVAFARDERGRLAEATRAGGPVEHLQPDVTGNLAGGPLDDSREYGPGGRIMRAGDVRYAHDSDGQLQEAAAGAETWKYKFNAVGLLEGVVRPDGDTVTFAYDALGRRVTKTSDTTARRFIWDGDTPVHELSSTEGTVSWVFEPGTLYPLARQASDGTVGVVRDYLGTPEALIADDGGVQTLGFTATGLPADGASAATTAMPWRYEGQYADDETGLHYNRFRYYDPRLGRYISKDPLGVLGGLNLYAYVADPTAITDPFGLLDAYDTAPMGSSSHVGDGNEAHELLQSAWLKEHAPDYTTRNAGIGRQNPAMALPPDVHAKVTARQRAAGLHDPAVLAAQTAEQNMKANAKILEAELVAQGFSKKEARDMVRSFKQEAEEYAESVKCA